jgi:AraC-like DNA-binding protein
VTNRDYSGIPAGFVIQLVELVARWGVGPDALFDRLDLDIDGLEKPDARIPIAMLEPIVERAHRLTGQPALGVYLGTEMRVSSHGYLGFAAMTASTLREALDITIRFTPTRTSAVALRLHTDADLCALVLDECVPLGAAEEMVILSLIVGIRQIVNTLTEKRIEGELDVTFRRPTDFERFHPGARIRFGQPVNQLVFSSSVLDLPIVSADRVACRLAREQSERELALVDLQPTFDTRVRGLVLSEEGGYRSLAEVAEELRISPRTLKRRLAEHGTNFSDLRERLQREYALLLLRSTKLSLEIVAERVGYSDGTNFTRAFRRWMGTTPAAYRRGTRRRKA